LCFSDGYVFDGELVFVDGHDVTRVSDLVHGDYIVGGGAIICIVVVVLAILLLMTMLLVLFCG